MSPWDRKAVDKHVTLRSPCRQPGRRPHALDVEDDRRDLGIVRKTGELAHERDPGTRCRGHRPGPRPAGADRHPERRDLVLRLHDGEAGLAGFLVDPILAEIVNQRLTERRRWRDRIPGDDGHAGHQAADGGGGVAVDQDAALVLVHRLDQIRVAFLQMLFREGVADIERRPVDGHDLDLVPELLPERDLHLVELDPEQPRQHAVIDHVANTTAQRDLAGHVADELVERHRIAHQVAAHAVQLQRLVVDDRGAQIEIEHILPRRLRIHGHEDFGLLLPADIAVLVGPDREPGRQAGDVRREHILGRDRHTHLEDCA